MRELWVLFAAIVLHGAGHWVAARCCGVRLRRLRLSATGLRLISDRGSFPSYRAELAIALGGPLGNLLGNALPIALSLLPFPALRSACREVVSLSLFLAGWNLLPLDGFDGGRILRCLLLGSKRPLSLPLVDGICRISSALCLTGLWLLAVYFVLRTARAISLFWFCLQLFWGAYVKEEA